LRHVIEAQPAELDKQLKGRLDSIFEALEKSDRGDTVRLTRRGITISAQQPVLAGPPRLLIAAESLFAAIVWRLRHQQ
jgi:hypothetical protein